MIKEKENLLFRKRHFCLGSFQLIGKNIFSRGGALGYFLGGYVPLATPNWHPVLEKISPKIDTPF